MSGIIDIVVNLFTPQEVELGQTGLDEDFKKTSKNACRDEGWCYDP